VSTPLLKGQAKEKKKKYDKKSKKYCVASSPRLKAGVSATHFEIMNGLVK